MGHFSLFSADRMLSSSSKNSPIEKFQNLKFNLDDDYMKGLEIFNPITPSSPSNNSTFSDFFPKFAQDGKMRKRRFGGKKSIFTSMAPTDMDFSLVAPVYKTLYGVKFSVHMDDFLEMYKKRSIIPTEINHGLSTIKVVRFMPCLANITDEDFYGNVQFYIPLEQLFQRFGSTLHFAGTKLFNHAMRTTLILSEKPDFFKPLYDMTQQNGPMVKKDKDLSSAVACIGKEYTKHELMLNIEVTEKDCRWLYNECTIEFTDHVDCIIGTDRPRNCKLSCKYTQTKEETETFIEENCPNY